MRLLSKTKKTLSGNYDIIIVGGGLAGLTSAIALSKVGLAVLLLEKKTYPYHKVCGEYISNEVLPYLKSLGLNPFDFGASNIRRLRISTPSGHNIFAPLEMGGFGISRYTLDFQLAKLAISAGTDVKIGTTVSDIAFQENSHTVTTRTGETFNAPIVIGSWGKRDSLDKRLDRKFMVKHTGYMGVKFHLRTHYPINEIGLDNYSGGYSGISAIEDGKFNFCTLYKRSSQRQSGTLQQHQEEVIYRNPKIKILLQNSEILFETPLVINEICFAPKPLIENHILLAGDTAGLITPLCGNGMSMAIGAGKLLSDLLIAQRNTIASGDFSIQKRGILEQEYSAVWQSAFSRRLFWGRNLQRFFGQNFMTETFLRGVHAVPFLERRLIAATHGAVL